MSAPDPTQTLNGLDARAHPLRERLHATAVAPGGQRRLCGWGRTSPCQATVIAPASVEQVRAAVLQAGAQSGLIARGAGRSYGDAAQNAGGVVLDLARISAVELREGPSLRVGAGARLSRVLAVLAGAGLTLPVLPGTRHITVGGAIAADVHGKNHRRDGSFGHHVQSLLLCTPDGALREVSRSQEPELFHATLGGMGLTGVVVEATLRPGRLAGALLDGDVDRTAGIEQAVAVMREDAGHRYSIAWIDLIARGRAFGRSVVLRCNDRPWQRGDRSVPGGRIALPGRPGLRVPDGLPSPVLAPGLVGAFNALRWHRAPDGARGRPITFAENFFPLDVLGDWNRLYGPAGLVQYQFAVPEDRAQTVVEVVQSLRGARQPMYLAVLKRFGAPSGGMLSFPMPGWTLAVDLPAATPGLGAALRHADELVVQAGGRVYLAKDARLGAEMLPAMYPALDRFMEIRSRVDPQGLLRSDQARRLGLAAGGAG